MTKGAKEAKKVVYYKAGTQLVLGLGKSAFVQPEGNCNLKGVGNKTIVTSNVLRYDAASGTIETAVTIYIPFRTELKR